ncbi:Vitamin B12 transporter BtuB [Pseudoalteromonas sp. THAF3]|uniref:TonB-dependent receptor n=1 Tax=Pseudoalteromonas sp. THAF3 TaxID=2587843 RepID=UPI00126980F4|nr:TonB-dependent receptor [Pseudoalteromonas sp. THAF3]QFU04143.1 Vitamin B12 transporter BtuB [Pseudoalteromonas sp. THAF3]
MLLRLLTIALPWLILFSSCTYAQSEHSFALPEATLQQRLLDIAAQSNWQLNAAAIEQSPPLAALNGRYSLEHVLNLSLRDTHYDYALDVGERRIVITAANEATPKGDFERIIVTGVSGQRRNILNSSIAITQLSNLELRQRTPYSSAEVLKNVTGFWVEDSGGETNNNVSPRGLRGGEGFRFISLMEDGLPMTYDGIWSDFFLRPDLTHQRIEAVRGGSSGIFTLNGPAAMVNYIGRRGSHTPLQLLKLSQGLNYDYSRLDGVASGPINEQLFYTVGGFYRFSDGIREPGFISDLGGQLSARLSLRTDAFELDVIYKHLQDNTSFYAPLVMQNHQGIEALSSLPHDYGTLLSKDMQLLNFSTPEGTTTHDLEDAQQTRMNSYTVLFNAPLSTHLAIDNRTRYAKLNNSLYTLMNLGNQTINSAEQRLTLADVSQFKDNAADDTLSLAYQRVSDGSLIADPSTLNNNGLVTATFPLYSRYQQTQLINHLSLSYQDTDWAVTLGHLYAHSDYGALPLDQWLGELLTDVQHQPQRLDIVLIDEHNQVVDKFTDSGFLSHAGPVYLKGHGESQSHSLYTNIDWRITEQLRLDAAIRHEHLTLDSTSAQGQRSQADNGQLFYSHYAPSTSLRQHFSDNAISVGVNYQAAEHMAVFARYADAFEMPRLINFGNALGWAGNAHQRGEVDYGKPIRLTLSEVGLRYQTAHSHFSGALFTTHFDPLPFTVYRGATSPQHAILINTQTTGVEFEYEYRYNASWQLKAIGVWQDAGFYGIPASLPQSQFNGNQITRTPELQLRLTPQYSQGPITAALTFSYIGERYSDVANRFALPAYHTWDLFSEVALNEHLKVQLEIKNLTNTLGLTEGNPRDDLSHQEALFYARPIFGRTITLSMSYEF